MYPTKSRKALAVLCVVSILIQNFILEAYKYPSNISDNEYTLYTKINKKNCCETFLCKI